MANRKPIPHINVPIMQANGSMELAWYLFLQWVSENAGTTDLSDYFTKEETQALLDAKANIDDLSDVAFSGDYDDLSNKPTIPDAQIQSDWNQADNTKVDYIKNKPTIPTVNNPTITISQGGVTKGSFTLNQVSGDTIDLDAGGSGSYHPDLFDVKWADHICNDVQWLRADTFSWQSGAVYQVAYQHLEDDIDGKTLQSETVAGTTIQFYLADDGHKICPASEESNVAAIYTATGVAWYYVIDTANTRFKLPRTKFGFTGIRSGVGNYIEAGLPNITGTFGVGPYTETTSASLRSTYATGAFASGPSTNAPNNVQGAANYGTHPRGTTFDASRSSSVYGNSDTVQPKATEMYLYFYVGEFTQTALENTAGLNAELFNSKANVDMDNLTVAGKSLISGLGMPSSSFIDLTLGASGSTYTAPANGWFCFSGVQTSSGGFCRIVSDDTLLASTSQNSFSNTEQECYVPARKGAKVHIYYTNLTSIVFRFIYSQGEV